MQQSPTSGWTRFSNWLHALPAWKFSGALYLLRWAVILPLSYILSRTVSVPPEAVFQFEGNPWYYLIPFLFVAPLLETLLECSLPHWIMYGLLKLQKKSPWPFVVVSALVMVSAHPLVIPTVVFAFVTGAFLAYVYHRFATESRGKAILHTAVFHAGINIVGWSMLMWGYYA